MREVHLVEGEEPTHATDAAGAGPGRGRLPWPWLVAGAACLLVALVSVQQAIGARDALADSPPSTVHPVPAPARTLAPLWRLDATADGATPVGSVAVGATVGDEGVTVVGIDPASGAHAWSVTAPSAGDPDGVRCAPLDAPDGTPGRAVCVTAHRSDEAPEPRPETVVVVDTATGALVGTWATDLQAWGRLGDRVVVAVPDDDDTTFGWTVAAHEATGAVTWTTSTSRAPLGGPDTGIPLGDELVGTDAWVAVTDRGHAWVLRADGTVRDDRAIGTGWAAVTRSGGVSLSGHLGYDDAGSVLLLDDAAVPVPGWVVPVAQDDGSAPGVELYTVDGGHGAGLVARDGATGAELWRDADVWAGDVVVRDGVVLVAGQDDVRAYDLADGTRRWTARLPGAAGLWLDGDVLLATAPANVTVLALDPRSGRALWKAAARHLLPDPGTGEQPSITPWAGELVATVGGESWVIG